MARRAATAIVALVALLALGGCSLRDHAGLGRDRETGNPTLQVILCEGERVTSVRLHWATLDDDGYSRDALLWQIDATRPSATARFVVGRTPTGFRESVPLEVPIPEHVFLVAHTEGGDASRHGDYAPTSELRADELLVEGSHMSIGELRQMATDDCEFDPLSMLGLPWSGYVVLALLAVLSAWGIRESVLGRRARVGA